MYQDVQVYLTLTEICLLQTVNRLPPFTSITLILFNFLYVIVLCMLSCFFTFQCQNDLKMQLICGLPLQLLLASIWSKLRFVFYSPF